MYDDYKTVPDETMSYIRGMVVNAIVKKRYRPDAVADAFNVIRSAVYEWLNRYKEGGYDALETRTAKGVARKITAEMEVWLKETVLTKTPVDFK